MKFHFEPNLDYQCAAIEAVCDLFRGQEVCRAEFTVTLSTSDLQLPLGFVQNDLGIGNQLTLLDAQLLQNLQNVQLRNGLPRSTSLTSGDFTIEMETGTGKTYVYLRTIFELNKRFGFTKFVIVVPSIAIKEGVYKSLEITEDHFRSLYANAPFNYYLYDSSKLGQVRSFATSSSIQIMVVTVGAINKQDVNNLYKESEKMGGAKPIDLIKAANPIVIVDEPQSVDGGLQGAGKAALDAMNPLCTLRYSATHVDKHHMVYRLDAVDAYERGLVKQIEVASATVEDAYNKPYVRFLKVENRRGTVSALVEIDVKTSAGIARVTKLVQDGESLEFLTRRKIYADHYVGTIQSKKGDEYMELRAPGREAYLRLGQASGDVDTLAVQRQMIRRTIKEHFDKEKRLHTHGIKVLSLFFIDSVDKYRKYDASGNPVKGVYAEIFEEEFRGVAKLPDYNMLFKDIDITRAAEEVHDGYFSIDRRGGWTDTDENNQTSRDNAERAYNLIMKEKEKLLRFDTPLKFIFSHSALREGWDNPNIFQICTLRDIRSERERRQTVGRGLRLCVNQDGTRLRGFDTNTLTVVANERYEEFAANLQREIEEDTGFRFGVVAEHQFATITVASPDGTTNPLGFEASKALWEHLRVNNYIDAQGAITETLRQALSNKKFTVPDAYSAHVTEITAILRKHAGSLTIKNADERCQVLPRLAVLRSQEFKELWDRIKHKTTYRVQFDNEKLINDCIGALRNAPAIPRTRLQWRKAGIAIGKSGVDAMERDGAATVILQEGDPELPDVLTELQERTQLTRRTIQRILLTSERLDDFKVNPQQFIDLMADVINLKKRLAIVDGIKYQRLGEDYYYAQELFEQEELTGYLKNMLKNTTKSVYEHVIYDSDTEAAFAQEMENNGAVKVYAKLPGWFKVLTPLGSYNPDWAVLVEQDGEERLYFVVETKDTLFTETLRQAEAAKIECGKAHFTAIEQGAAPAKYVLANTFTDFTNHW